MSAPKSRQASTRQASTRQASTRQASTRQILDMNAYDFESDAATAASEERSRAGPGSSLLARRRANFGAAAVLFYQRPIEMASARGAWMVDVEGRRYLDFYNNVPSVGHAHPRVVAAVSRQIATLNTNTRYLTAEVETYLERLKAKLPDALSTVALTCTGSEANDLAMRVAMKASGAEGFVVTETAYHGNTHLVIQASPAAYKTGGPPKFVATAPAPGRAAFGEDVADGFLKAVMRAVGRLKRRKCGFAGFMCDAVFSSDGVFTEPAGFLKPVVDYVRAEGGLYIADEVQPGFARTGGAFWGFERHGATPDIVTMGKPMGNGFPMAGMAARPALLSAFCEDFGYFNTFGGNPVAAAAGLAVLEVIEEEGLQENAAQVGAALKQALETVAAADPRVAEVRGAGLFLGVDLVSRDDPAQPDPAMASRVVNGLKARGVLIGAAGRFGHTLKVRPPLCLTLEEAAQFVEALRAVLAEDAG